ncbi:hypothetical protein YC2023_114091 [Brassica napus]
MRKGGEDGGDNCGKDQEVPECSERQRQNKARQKGKNKRPLEYETDSDTDSDDAMVVPVLRASIPETANAARPVARRLVFGIPGIPTTQEGAGSSSSSTEALPEVADEFGQHLGKFDEALHEMLSDP